MFRKLSQGRWGIWFSWGACDLIDIATKVRWGGVDFISHQSHSEDLNGGKPNHHKVTLLQIYIAE